MKKHIATADLGAILGERLKRFSQATGAPKTAIIRSALNEFIDKHLSQNAGWRERFERFKHEDEARAKAPKRSHLTVIK